MLGRMHLLANEPSEGAQHVRAGPGDRSQEHRPEGRAGRPPLGYAPVPSPRLRGETQVRGRRGVLLGAALLGALGGARQQRIAGGPQRLAGPRSPAPGIAQRPQRLGRLRPKRVARIARQGHRRVAPRPVRRGGPTRRRTATTTPWSAMSASDSLTIVAQGRGHFRRSALVARLSQQARGERTERGVFVVLFERVKEDRPGPRISAAPEADERRPANLVDVALGGADHGIGSAATHSRPSACSSARRTNGHGSCLAPVMSAPPAVTSPCFSRPQRGGLPHAGILILERGAQRGPRIGGRAGVLHIPELAGGQVAQDRNRRRPPLGRRAPPGWHSPGPRGLPARRPRARAARMGGRRRGRRAGR